MSKDILKLEPQAVWKHFYSLTQIPRPSKHEQKVADLSPNLEGIMASKPLLMR